MGIGGVSLHCLLQKGFDGVYGSYLLPDHRHFLKKTALHYIENMLEFIYAEFIVVSDGLLPFQEYDLVFPTIIFRI